MDSNIFLLLELYIKEMCYNLRTLYPDVYRASNGISYIVNGMYRLGRSPPGFVHWYVH